jgi:hypothetical protein
MGKLVGLQGPAAKHAWASGEPQRHVNQHEYQQL